MTSFPSPSSGDLAEPSYVLKALWGKEGNQPAGARLLDDMIAASDRASQNDSLSILGTTLGDTCLVKGNGFRVRLPTGSARNGNAGLPDERLVAFLSPARYDRITISEVFFSLDGKIDTLGRINDSLKPDGEFFLLDCILGEERDTSGEARSWLEQQKKHPWNRRQFELSFAGLGLNMKAAEDVSKRYTSLILTEWIACLEYLKTSLPPKGHRKAILHEAEQWFRFLDLLKKGGLRMVRFHAVKRTG